MFKIKVHKALIVVLVLYFFSVIAFSQTIYSNKPYSSFFLTAGLTSSYLLNDTISYKSGVLFDGGFIYSIRASDKMNIAMECLFTGKGVKRDSPLVKYRFYYVDIPLYLQLKLGENIRFNFGPQYSIFVNSQIIYLDGSKANGINIEKYRGIGNHDFAFLLGTEIDITESLAIAARYTLSGAVLYDQHQPCFGVFQISFKYTAFENFKQIFHKKKKEAAIN